MKRALFFIAAISAAAIAAGASQAPPARITNGMFWIRPDAGVELEMCGQAWKADGGAKGLDAPCVHCFDWNWNACEAKWRQANELIPPKK